jgi:hypothetical protein
VQRVEDAVDGLLAHIRGQQHGLQLFKRALVHGAGERRQASDSAG